jgi:hypothetical protein
MNTFIDNYPNPTSQRIGQSHIRIVDKDDPDNRYIDVFYDRDLDEIILFDGQGTFKPIVQSDEFNSKVVFTIYKDNYTVEIGDHSSGIIYKSIFSSKFTIKVRLYILIHGIFPDYWWSAGFDNLFIRGEKDNDPPDLKIKKPEKALYLFNKKILPRFFRITKIVGTVTIEINATDVSSGIEKVEFYINGKYMANDTTEPYTFNWRGSRPRLFHLFLIKVIAYDNAGNSNIEKMLVRKFL